MGFEADDEILQDFLVEAGEILEQLSAQLVELESRHLEVIPRNGPSIRMTYTRIDQAR